jgi:hypothetical protein
MTADRIALVVWHTVPCSNEQRASWTYHPTRAAAAAAAPADGQPISIVDTARKPWVRYPERHNEKRGEHL